VAAPHLRLLAGSNHPPLPAGLVGRARLQQLFNDLRQGADYVLVDTVPVSTVADASAVVAAADGVLLVVDLDQARRRDLLATKEQLGHARAKVLGIVINRADVESPAYHAHENHRMLERAPTDRSRQGAPKLVMSVLMGDVPQAALRHGVELVVHTSTSEVYGSARTIPITDGHPLEPQSPYAASKFAADKVMESWHRSYDPPVTVVRPFKAYGPRQSVDTVAAFVAAAQRCAPRRARSTGGLQSGARSRAPRLEAGAGAARGSRDDDRVHGAQHGPLSRGPLSDLRRETRHARNRGFARTCADVYPGAADGC
jgi:hypothetical protein